MSRKRIDIEIDFFASGNIGDDFENIYILLAALNDLCCEGVVAVFYFKFDIDSLVEF